MNQNQQEEIDQQRKLLKTHRATLSHYLHQKAQMGPANIPPSVANGIVEARDNIRRIKRTLRGWGVTVEDHPDDELVPADDESSAVNDTKTDKQPDALRRLLLSSIRSGLNEDIEKKKQDAADSRLFDFGEFQRDEEVGPSKLGTEGLARYHQHGFVVWHDFGKHARKVFAVYGGIGYRFQKMGQDSWIRLGFPITDEYDAAPSPFGSTGRNSLFEDGVIVWYGSGSFREQSYAVWGPISKKYNSLGGSGSYLGFPTSEPYPIEGGERCDFEGGTIVFLNTSNSAHVVRQLLRLDYSDSPFKHEWRQYAGVDDPDCISIRLGTSIGGSKSFIAFNFPLEDRAIQYPASGFRPYELREKYCGVTVKSLSPGYWIRFYLKVQNNANLDQYLEFDSEDRKKELIFDREDQVEYWKVPLPILCNNSAWHTFVIDLEDQVQEGFTKAFKWLRRFYFRGSIGIADLLVSNSREAIEKIALNPIRL